MQEPEAGAGRKPPPIEHRFVKRRSGNPRGRPTGAVSKKRITRKVVLRKLTLSIAGRPVRKTVLEWVLRALNIENASGKPRACALHEKYLQKAQQKERGQVGGFLIVPERTKTTEEALAIAEEYSQGLREPGSA